VNDKAIKVGDLVTVNEKYRHTYVPPGEHGLVISQIPDADPSYFTWHVLFESGVYPYHQDCLEVIHENR